MPVPLAPGELMLLPEDVDLKRLISDLEIPSGRFSTWKASESLLLQNLRKAKQGKILKISLFLIYIS